MIASKWITAGAAKIFSDLNVEQRQWCINTARKGLNKASYSINSLLGGLTNQRGDEVDAMLDRGALYFKRGRLYYTNSDKLFWRSC